MAYFADIVMTPATGSVLTLDVPIMRGVRQADSYSSGTLWRPSGFFGTGSLVLPANPRRALLHMRNSGSEAIGVSYGAPTLYPFFSFMNLGGAAGVIRWFAGTTYTGPVYAYWLASGSLSASRIIAVELSYGG